jgi:hypothetical protein
MVCTLVRAAATSPANAGCNSKVARLASSKYLTSRFLLGMCYFQCYNKQSGPDTKPGPLINPLD